MASTTQCQCIFTLLFILVIWVSQVISMPISPNLEEALMSKKHEEWMTYHGRVYKDAEEKEKRFQIFKSNVKHVESVNSDPTRTYKLAVNKFADLTVEEFKASRTGFKMLPAHLKSVKKTPFRYKNVTNVPKSIDWRKKGAVTPIKDQKQCGCCWAFSAVAAMEGITQIKTGKLISLSEQELLDCDTAGDNQGCDGGLMDGAFKFIKKNKGIATEAEYPYKQARGTCNAKKASHVATITGYEDVPVNSEKDLLKAVANQPVSIAISTEAEDFMLYSGGVFSGKCGDKIDHAVTAVGYGTTKDGTKYWIMKNSWGTGWGVNGYFTILRDADKKQGQCNIAQLPSYPTV